MVRQTKAKKSKPKWKRPHINMLHVVYVLVAAAVIFSMVASIFVGVAGPEAQSTGSPSTSQTTRNTTGERVPITVTPAPSTGGPTPSSP